MLPLVTPKRPPSERNVSFSHHEAFALHLVADTPSPVDKVCTSVQGRLTDDFKDHVLRNAHSFAARSTRSYATTDTLHPPPKVSRQYGGPVLGEIDPNNQALRPGPNHYRPSPTPSLKKRKAEQILKDHGSPPGLRVTAGGRIVPSDQSPLCSPRFGYSAIQKNGGLIRFAANYPPPPDTMATMEGTPKHLPNGFVAQDPGGRLLQVVDGHFLPVNEINGIPQLYIAAPNLNNFPPGKMRGDSVRQHTSQGRDKSSTAGTRIRQPTLTTAIQIQALDKQYGKLEQESRDLDKLEVLQRSTMSSKAYQQLIQTRRELVTRLNDIRISLKALRDQQNHSPEQSSPKKDEHITPTEEHMPFMGVPVIPHNHMPQGPIPGWTPDGLATESHGMMQFSGGHVPVQPDLGYFFPQPAAYSGQMAPYSSMPATAGSFPPLFNLMGVQPAEMFHSYATVTNVAPQMFATQLPLVPTTSATFPLAEPEQSSQKIVDNTGSSEKNSPRRSHALEIKNPEIKSDVGQGNKSSLNPMSPSYQPASISTKPSTPQSKSARNRAESPSTALVEAVRAHNAWVGETRGGPQSGNSRRGGFCYESSNASFTTADFFPHNPRDHSSNKQTYPLVGNRSTSSIKRSDDVRFSESEEMPGTPEKECHNPNWNPTIPDTAFDTMITPSNEQEITVAPPGTPARENGHIQIDPVDSRSQHNMSPKSRRPDLQSFKSASKIAVAGSDPTSPVITRRAQDRKSTTSSSRLPVSSTGSAYMLGFKAGEARMPIAPTSTGVWLDGYCAGLRASMNVLSDEAASAPQDPTESNASVNSEGTVPILSNNITQPPKTSGRPPFELNAASLDTLKETVFSAQNENVLLSPETNGAGASQITSFGLGSWAKHHEPPSSAECVLTQLRNGEAAFSERTASMVQRQLLGSGLRGNDPKADSSASNAGPTTESRRNFSVQSQPNIGSQAANLKAVYPGHRVLSSQLEWKSGSSIAQVAGLAHGYVAQYDGTLNDMAALGEMPPLTRMSGNIGTIVPNADIPTGRKGIPPPPGRARFVEGSMRTDEHLVNESSTSSPSRKSPTKAMFAQIAGKAGIKVRVEDQADQERMSPKEKPRWRDVWRKGH